MSNTMREAALLDRAKGMSLAIPSHVFNHREGDFSRYLNELKNFVESHEQARAGACAHSKEWFDEAFTHAVTEKPYEIPGAIRRLSERICRSYGISGICDPMYIANVIAFELGLGDGVGNFKDEKLEALEAAMPWLRAAAPDTARQAQDAINKDAIRQKL